MPARPGPAPPKDPAVAPAAPGTVGGCPDATLEGARALDVGTCSKAGLRALAAASLDEGLR